MILVTEVLRRHESLLRPLACKRYSCRKLRERRLLRLFPTARHYVNRLFEINFVEVPVLSSS